MTKSIEKYVQEHNIKVEVTRERGAQVDKDGWEHHAYVLRLVWDDGSRSRFMDDVPWKQGYGVESVPQDEPARVLDALVSEAMAYADATDFADFAATFGYDEDSRKAYEMYMQCGEIHKRLATFLGGRDELENLAYNYERL